jgi:hypothetical protein
VGQGDLTGSEVYLRKNNGNEVRSGKDLFSGYLSGSRTSWYDPRLFPGAGNQNLGIDAVQRLSLYPLPDQNLNRGPLILSRNAAAGGWTLSGSEEFSPDNQKVESYIRSTLNAEGDDFAGVFKAEEDVFNEGRVVLELGDGTTRVLRLGPVVDEQNRRNATVSGSFFVYRLSSWTVNQIFRDAAYFAKQ